MQFTNLVMQYNIHGKSGHIIINFLLYALCICIRYLLSVVLTFNLILQIILLIPELEEGTDFPTAASVYEHFDAVIF